tara:strand:- start:114 stop:545 length:432 start_codon:yes stop_codon:yes gene_type:complete
MTFEEEERDADDDQKRCHFPISPRETGVDFEFSKSSSFKEEEIEEDIFLSELKERKRRSKGRASRSKRKSAFDAFKLLLLFSGIRKACFWCAEKEQLFRTIFFLICFVLQFYSLFTLLLKSLLLSLSLHFSLLLLDQILRSLY